MDRPGAWFRSDAGRADRGGRRAVLHGRRELGFVDELTFRDQQAGPRVLLLGGRAWRVTHIDWQRKTAHVEPSEDRGRTRWKGEGQGLSFRLCQAIKRVLGGDDSRGWWSRRAREEIDAVRGQFPWITANGTTVVADQGAITWWTFAGLKANASLAPTLAQVIARSVTHENLALRFGEDLTLDDAEEGIGALKAIEVREIAPTIDPAALRGLKFSECLPAKFATELLQVRTLDLPALVHVLREPIRFTVSIKEA